MMRCVVLAGVLGVAAGQTVSLHGSGTTNPKKVHWELMSQMEAMASTPVEMSYRYGALSLPRACAVFGRCAQSEAVMPLIWTGRSDQAKAWRSSSPRRAISAAPKSL